MQRYFRDYELVQLHFRLPDVDGRAATDHLNGFCRVQILHKEPGQLVFYAGIHFNQRNEIFFAARLITLASKRKRVVLFEHKTHRIDSEILIDNDIRPCDDGAFLVHVRPNPGVKTLRRLICRCRFRL